MPKLRDRQAACWNAILIIELFMTVERQTGDVSLRAHLDTATVTQTCESHVRSSQRIKMQIERARAICVG